jgi:NCS2 family nucleobase:cation symporter-2
MPEANNAATAPPRLAVLGAGCRDAVRAEAGIVLAGLQHVGVMCATLTFPIVVGRQVGLESTSLAGFVATALLVLAAANLLQALRPPVGSGYLTPTSFTATYLGPSMLAAEMGRLPLVFGMTLLAGCAEAAMSRILDRLRAAIPVEFVGLIIFLVGLTNGIAGFRQMFGTDALNPDMDQIGIGALALGCMIALQCLPSVTARLYAAAIGMVVGYVAALGAGLVSTANLAAAQQSPLFAAPALAMPDLSFDAALAVPFAVVDFAAAMKQTAFVYHAQRMTQRGADLDHGLARRSVLADGAGSVASGLIGSLGVNASASSAGLLAASGMTNRRVGVYVAAVFALLAVMPGAALLLSSVPRGVVGAALIFTGAFVLTSGVKMMSERGLDQDMALMLGLALLASFAVELCPAIRIVCPAVLLPLLSSPIVGGTLAAAAILILQRVSVMVRR